MNAGLSTPLSLAERIRLARNRSGLDQTDLALTVGVSSKTVSRWERGAHEPKATELSALASALDVSVSWLLGGDTGFAADPEGVAS